MNLGKKPMQNEKETGTKATYCMIPFTGNVQKKQMQELGDYGGKEKKE